MAWPSQLAGQWCRIQAQGSTRPYLGAARTTGPQEGDQTSSGLLGPQRPMEPPLSSDSAHLLSLVVIVSETIHNFIHLPYFLPHLTF